MQITRSLGPHEEAAEQTVSLCRCTEVPLPGGAMAPGAPGDACALLQWVLFSKACPDGTELSAEWG